MVVTSAFGVQLFTRRGLAWDKPRPWAMGRSSLHYSWRFIAKACRREARRALGGVKPAAYSCSMSKGWTARLPVAAAYPRLQQKVYENNVGQTETDPAGYSKWPFGKASDPRL